MADSKLIAIAVDPNLDRQWRFLGLSAHERSCELEKLESALVATYQSFMAATSAFVDERRDELREAQASFRRAQQVYGDTTTVIPQHSSESVRDQIEATQRARAELVQAHQNRVRELERLHHEATQLFDLIGVDVVDRGEFAEVGECDLTADRVRRFKETIKRLKADRDQRITLHASLTARVAGLMSELAETPSDELQGVLDGRMITNAAIQILGKSIDALEELKERRSAEIESLSAEIGHFYVVLAVDPADRVAKQTERTQAVVDLLRQEVEFLREQCVTRLPQVIASAAKEISRLCNDLRMPSKLRPKFQGGDQEAEAAFLTQKLQELRQKKIQCQPIIDVMSQIESCRSSIARNKSHRNNDRRGAKKAVEEDGMKRRAIELLPKLEQKLLALLLQFRQENGYEFDFHGVTGLHSLAAYELADGGFSAPKAHSHRKASTLGHQILMHKIHDSLMVGYEAQPAHRATTKMSNSTMRNSFL
jgi:hypothetical protein